MTSYRDLTAPPPRTPLPAAAPPRRPTVRRARAGSDTATGARSCRLSGGATRPQNRRRRGQGAEAGEEEAGTVLIGG